MYFDLKIDLLIFSFNHNMTYKYLHNINIISEYNNKDKTVITI